MSVLKRILCPIDFDEYSGRALARAQDLALRHHAELRLLHVFPSRPESISMPRASIAPQIDRTRAMHLDQLAATIRHRGVPCEVTMVRGDPAFQILQAARDGAVDFIVMATHGRHGVRRVMLGSVTEAVLHATPCPLLTISPRDTGAGGLFPRVLCAVDLSPSSAATYSHALAMAQEAHGLLTLLNVIDPAFSSSPPEAARTHAEEALERLHARMPVEGAHWCEVRDAVRQGDSVAEVLKAAGEDEADLIVIGAGSRRPSVTSMVGSFADRIVREAPCPVLAIPSPAPVMSLPILYPAYA